MMMKPKIVVLAGPNGSGKSTVFSNCKNFGTYINADEIKAAMNISDMEAAVLATELREKELAAGHDFTFETVLSTGRNLELLKRAKESGYFIRGFYVLTCSPRINIMRVKMRVEHGGHDVPEDKIITRYHRSLKLLPEFVRVCDICSVYDNSLEKPFRIYKKYHGDIVQSNEIWSSLEIIELIYGEKISPSE